MRAINMKKIGSIILATLLCFLSITGACSQGIRAAEEEPDAVIVEDESETDDLVESGLDDTEAELETETPSEPEMFEVIVTSDGETKTIENDTDVSFSSVTYNLPSATAEIETENVDGEEDTTISTGTLILTEESGVIHLFENTDLTVASDYSIVTKLSFFFVKGTDSSGEEVWFYETADDITLDEPITMYTVGMVNIREEPDGDSTLLATADRGSELEVIGGTSKWFMVTQGETSGYLAARYLTESEEEAEAAIEEEATARAAIEAAAAAAAAQAAAEAAAAQSYSYSSSAPSEVSREAVYDCDGSGHGYYEITYSDGSVGYVDF